MPPPLLLLKRFAMRCYSKGYSIAASAVARAQGPTPFPANFRESLRATSICLLAALVTGMVAAGRCPGVGPDFQYTARWGPL